jgi:Methylamine utilisation protein MauE
MSALSTGIAVSLALVLLVSGVGKLARPSRFAAALSGTYGVPSPIARPLSIGVPIYELATAVLLVPTETRIAGLLASAFFLSATLVLASAAYLAGRTGDCGCFGDVIEDRLGRSTLLRLSLLLALSCAAGVLTLPGVGSDLGLPGPAELTLSIGGLTVAALVLVAAARAARAMAREGE